MGCIYAIIDVHADLNLYKVIRGARVINIASETIKLHNGQD